jgi:hypothetical protein
LSLPFPQLAFKTHVIAVNLLPNKTSFTMNFSLVCRLFLAFICLLLVNPSYAQTCLGLTFKPGMTYELLSYSAKDKPNGKMTYTIKEARREGAITVIELEFQMTDEKGKSQLNPSVVKYTCTGTELIADLSGMMSANAAALKNSEVRMKTNRVAYPTKLVSNAKLPDGLMESELYTDGQKMMDMTISMANRQVGNQESITVPAGTYNAWKITSDSEMKNRMMGMGLPTFRVQTVSYRTNDALFDIRTETYRNGKLMSYTVLSKIN